MSVEASRARCWRWRFRQPTAKDRRQTRPGIVAASNEEDPLADDDPQSPDPRYRAVGAGRDAFAGRAGTPARPLRRQGVKSQPPAIGYQETIRKSITQRGQHKKQSGGHGQFGDVVLEIKPMPRGGGFEFHEKVVGGAVPRDSTGAVEEGVVDGLLRGPLGLPVIDVQVTLTDGSYHSVDYF